MKGRWIVQLNLLMAVGFIFMSGGCTPVMMGPQDSVYGPKYYFGTMHYTVDATVKRVHTATIQAFKDLDLLITSDTYGVDQARLTGTFPGGQEVSVVFNGLTVNASRIRVRVGLLGDQARSLMIINVIEKNL